MPKPVAEHKKLSWLAGRWDGEERLSPSPWEPEGGTATGHYDWRPALDGFYVIGDYRQEREGNVNFRGHAVIGWDAPTSRYVMFWFDSTGFVPATASFGTWDGDTLTVGHQDAMGHHRYSWTVRGDRMDMSIEDSPDGSDWSTFLEGSYRRV